MEERKGIVRFKGRELTLVGRPVGVGDKAPDFSALDQDLREVRLSDFAGKVVLISSTPSLDTPVCDMQAHRFNDEASGLPEDAVVINVSMDLPFAIKRFCTTGKVDRIKTLSDHREASFGLSYGLLIKELRLLARAVLVVDREGVVRYLQIVPEISEHPDYDRAMEELRKLL